MAITKGEPVLSSSLMAIVEAVTNPIVRHARQHQEARQLRGNISCEVCDFNFEGSYGVEYAEVHHIRPLAANDSVTITTLSDLAVLCANCHRIAHVEPSRVKSVKEIKAMLTKQARGIRRSRRAV